MINVSFPQLKEIGSNTIFFSMERKKEMTISRKRHFGMWKFVASMQINIQSPTVLKWVFIPPFLKFFRQAKCDILWSCSLFKNTVELRNRIWCLISVEDPPEHKKKTNKESGGKDEGLLNIRPYVPRLK